MLSASFSLRCIGTAIPKTSVITMYSYPFNARGRNPWNRGFCDRPPADGRGVWRGGDGEFVRGDSQPRDANYGFPQGFNGNPQIPSGYPHQQYRARPPADGRGGWRGGGSEFASGDSRLRDVNYGFPQGFSGSSRMPGGYPHQQYRPRPPAFRPVPRPRPDDHRNWIFSTSQPLPQWEQFTVLSYNILADYLARDHRSNLYFHIPHHILDWEWRKRRLLLEFRLWAPDILCLQEVDRFQELEEELKIRGYTGIWKMRTGNAVDGCATFWQTNRFQLLQEEHIEFRELGLRDNVAQICVFESRNQIPVENPSANLPSSSDHSRGVNRIVVCNIHVLYNPKRGEIKLGQVRVLLDRAYAVSRNWNDAPVIVCGDFNCTPESPLYKFISEQKLSLSGIARNQISGQHAATIYAPRPYGASGLYRAPQSTDNSSETKGVEEVNNGIGNHLRPQNNIENAALAVKLPITQRSAGTLDVSGKPLPGSQIINGADASSDVIMKENEAETLGCCSDNVASRFIDPSQGNYGSYRTQNEFHQSVEDAGNQEVSSTFSFSDDGGSGGIPQDHEGRESVTHIVHPIQSESNGELSQGYMDSSTRETTTSKQCMETSVVPTVHEDLIVHSISKSNMSTNQDPSVKNRIQSQSDIALKDALADETSLDKKHLGDFGATASSVGMVLGTSFPRLKASTDSTLESMMSSADISNKVNLSESSCNTDLPDSSTCGDSLDEAGRITVDAYFDGDCKNSNSADVLEHLENLTLHGGDCKGPSGEPCGPGQDGHEINDLCLSEENSDPTFFEELLGTEDPCCKSGEAEFTQMTNSNIHKHYYDPYIWTPEEIEVASGVAGCASVEHSLKLRSAYADVEDYAGTKGSSREPQVTSYNRQFMGTVDYIWCSEGLQTVGVLDTIPKHILQRTPGFPTHKWGSDHLALVCQLAFTKGSQ